MYAMRMAAFALGLMAAGTALAETPATTTPPTNPQQQAAPMQPGMGPGGQGMGPGMMGQGMGQGMMGQGMGRGHGMFGQAPCGQQPAVEVTADSVKTHMEAWIARKGNSHIKIGAVTQQSDGTILATIVTKKENALVDKFVIDPKTNTRKRVE